MTVSAGDQRYTPVLNESLGIFFGDAVKATLRDPTQAAFFLRTVRWQKRAARTREGLARQGLHVPPILLFSITNRCNLHCRGCYHHALRGEAGPELTPAQVRRVVAEAQELGISFVVLAGGEPLVRPETLEITAAHPEVLFLVFTNGLLIDETVIATLKRQRNVVPVISMEGYQPDTDGRRGPGVSARLEQTVAALKKAHIFWGTSVTVTRTNHPTVTSETFVGALNRLGCKLFFFVEYSPVTPGTEDWVVDETQRQAMAGAMASFRERFSALFVSVPGDEDKFGGCLAAGRGFVHVSADGNVEPCPFVPYSDANLKQVSLKTALQSEFLAAVRNNSERLEAGVGGCALWKERPWLESILAPQAPEAANPEAVTGRAV
jgi:MoaA/NifB/PqqE/SkfB family radical SAM enzyme